MAATPSMVEIGFGFLAGWLYNLIGIKVTAAKIRAFSKTIEV